MMFYNVYKFKLVLIKLTLESVADHVFMVQVSFLICVLFFCVRLILTLSRALIHESLLIFEKYYIHSKKNRLKFKEL